MKTLFIILLGIVCLCSCDKKTDAYNDSYEPTYQKPVIYENCTDSEVAQYYGMSMKEFNRLTKDGKDNLRIRYKYKNILSHSISNSNPYYN